MDVLFVFMLWSLFGWFLLALGLGARRHRRDKEERERAHATATVTEHAATERRGRRGTPYTSCYPVVRFTADGAARTAKAEYAADPARLPVGTVVDIFYDPDDPSRFHFGDDALNGRPGRLLVAAGLTWIILAAAATGVVSLLSSGYDLSDIPDLIAGSRLFHRFFR